MAKFMLLALAGALGALARYGVSGAAHALVGRGFPWGTLAANTLGCLLFGVAFVWADERMLLRGDLRVAVLVGFLGAFTTFSSFVFETDQLLRHAQYFQATLNVFGELALGLGALWLGMALGRLV
jgi:CrcB protein